MDAIRYLNTIKRMCLETKCSDCKIKAVCEPNPGEYASDAFEYVVDIVERWAEEHPTMTNAMKFEEVFGVNLTLENKQACPPHRYTFACDGSGGDECRECQKWWDEPYVEPKEAE